MRIKDIMIQDVESLSPELSVREAIDILTKRKISGLPVLDKNGRLLGMFTEKNILSYLLPEYIQHVGKFIYQENPKAIKKKLAELVNLRVAQLMRQEVITVKEDTAICEAARVMLTQKARRLPVVDKENKVIGIIAREDILKAFYQQISCG